MKKIAVFASGSGTNYEAIVEAIKNDSLHADIALVVVDNPNAYVIKRANNHNHKLFIFNPKDYKKKSEYEALILKELEKEEIELVILAGYMRILSANFINKFGKKIVNLHPALLPSFKGAHAIVDAYNFGVKVFGITIHYIDETIDGGIILEQRAFHIDDDDSLESVETKIHDLEHKYYPITIERILKGEI